MDKSWHTGPNSNRMGCSLSQNKENEESPCLNKIKQPVERNEVFCCFEKLELQKRISFLEESNKQLRAFCKLLLE